YVSALNELDVTPRLGATSFVYAAAAALLVGLLLGIAPAFQVADRNLRGRVALQRLRNGRGESRLLRALVGAEVAAAVSVLARARLARAGLRRALLGDPGYATHGVYVYRVDLPPSRYPNAAAVARFAHEAADRLLAVPGVESATATTTQPLDPGT